jgi:glycosyltransferase involved in cell wall biosynthesis
VAYLKSTGPTQTESLKRILAALPDHNVPFEIMAVEEGSESVIFDSADVFIVLSESERDRMRLLEAMGRGCVPVVARGNGTLAELVKDRENGYVLPDGDAPGFAARLCALQMNPVLRRSVSARAFASASAFDTVDLFTASYSMLFDRVLRDLDLGIHRR